MRRLLGLGWGYAMKKNLLIAATAIALLTAGAASAKVFDFSFTGDNGVHGSGTFTTGPAGSPFTITGVTGTIFDNEGSLGSTPFTITNLSLYAGADNLLFFPASGSPAAFTDFGGISFSTTGGPDFNFGGGGTNPSGTVLNDSINDPSGFPGQFGSSNITLSVAAVPEAATWALMIVGLGAIGAGLRLQRRQESAATI
jgi:hypothetical protein